MALFQPALDLELDEGEEVIQIAKRHWIVLLQRGLIPIVIALVAGPLAIYRAIGGQFIESDVGRTGQIDFTNALVVVMILALIYLWFQTRRRSPKKPLLAIPYLIGILILGVVFFFRFRGGRVFYIDPFYAPGVDTLNGVLLLIALVALLASIYIAIDWANDFLVLTNTRVIVDDTQFLVRHVQQQMLIADIQQVNMRADTYLQYWLSFKYRPAFGNIVISSFSPRRLIFDRLANPKPMQDAILKEVNNIRRQEEPERLRRLIEDQVYGNKPAKKPGPAIQVEEKAGPLPWLFEPNPEINYETETVIWRPFWLFLLIAWLRPIGIIVGSAILFWVLAAYGVLNGWLALLLWLPFFLISAGWIFWIREEHQNDVYILTRQNITDVDRKPFGPEKRRVAPLGAIQDISYDVGYFETVLEFLFGFIYGDVVIETGGAGGGKFTFEHVPDPRGVQATINDYLTDFRKREKERSLTDSLALLKQYHEAQRAHDELIDWDKLMTRVAAEMPQRVDANLGDRVSDAVGAQMPSAVRRAARATARSEVLRLLRRFNARRGSS